MDKIKCCLIVSLIAFPHLSATGWEIYLGNYDITKFLRTFIVSEVFLAFELKRPRFESKSLGMGTWKYAYSLCFSSVK